MRLLSLRTDSLCACPSPRAGRSAGRVVVLHLRGEAAESGVQRDLLSAARAAAGRDLAAVYLVRGYLLRDGRPRLGRHFLLDQDRAAVDVLVGVRLLEHLGYRRRRAAAAHYQRRARLAQVDRRRAVYPLAAHDRHVLPPVELAGDLG